MAGGGTCKIPCFKNPQCDRAASSMARVSGAMVTATERIIPEDGLGHSHCCPCADRRQALLLVESIRLVAGATFSPRTGWPSTTSK